MKRYHKLISGSVKSVTWQEGSPACYLLAVDATPLERKYARTLEDRTIIHKPNVVKGKPISIGHSYSQVVSIPSATRGPSPWVIPISVRRIKSTQLGHVVGMEQIKDLINDDMLPFKDAVTVCLGDSAYSSTNSLMTAKDDLAKNLVLGVRIKGDRKAYRRFTGSNSPNHPKWYGDELVLNDPDSHFPCDLSVQFYEKTTTRGEIKNVVSIWKNIIFKGARDFCSYDYPCTLLRMVSYRKNGKRVFEKPLWIAFYGKRRDEISPFNLAEAYPNRFKIEHFFKFIKQNMLMNSFQTPDVSHEESWVKILQLAYLQLYKARTIAQDFLHPWERYLPKKLPECEMSPKKVQQYFYKIYKSLRETTSKPIPRGRVSGRRRGAAQKKRTRHKVIVKKKIEKKPQEDSAPPLEKLFDKSMASTNNAKTPTGTAKRVNSGFRNKPESAKPQGYCPKPLFPKHIFHDTHIPCSQSP